MKNILTLILFLIIASGIVFARYLIPLPDNMVDTPALPTRLTNGYINAVWDWEFPKSSGADVHTLTKDLSTKGINVVYINISAYVDIYEQPDVETKEAKINDFKRGLSDYITIARADGIESHAVVGAKNWGNPSHRYLNEIIINFLQEYNSEFPDSRLSGLQFDIEPYGQEGFETKQSKIFSDYLDTVEQITIKFSALQNLEGNIDPVDLGFAIPYWFDGENGNISKVVWKEEEKFVLYHLLNRLNTVRDSYVVLMSYRNFADGSDGVIEHSQTEASYLSEYFPKIGFIVGQETTNIQPKKTTYYDKKFSYMDDQLGKVVAAFENSENFKGFAFNNAAAFLKVGGSNVSK